MAWTYDTPTRVRFKTLLNEGYLIRGAARKLKIPRSSARYFIDKPDRQAKAPGAPRIVSDKQIQDIIQWFTGLYKRRVLPLKEIRKKFHLDCADITLLRAFQRHGYYYHVPDCKLVISKANRLKRWSFAIANWDRTQEY